jgi:hypothetical protein
MHTAQVGQRSGVVARIHRTVRSIRWRFQGRPMDAYDTDGDPMLAMLASLPIDDEPVTDEDRRRLDEGWRAYREWQ